MGSGVGHGDLLAASVAAVAAQSSAGKDDSEEGDNGEETHDGCVVVEEILGNVVLVGEKRV